MALPSSVFIAVFNLHSDFVIEAFQNASMQRNDSWTVGAAPLFVDWLPSLAAGLVHSRPEFLYFWFYFVIVNAVWILIPSIVIVNAARAIHAAVAAQQR